MKSLLSRHLLILIMALAMLILFSWDWPIPPFQHVFPGFVMMKANAALGLLALSLGCWFWESPGRGPLPRALGLGLISFVFILSILSLAQYALKVNLGIDELFLRAHPDQNNSLPPGRMAPATGICFLFISLALMLEAFTRVSKNWVQAILVFCWVFSFQAAVSYFAGYKKYNGLVFYTQMALHTSFSFLAVSSVLLARRSDVGFMGMMFSQTPAGRLGRRILLAAVCLPPLISVLQHLGINYQLFDVDFGTTLSIVANVTCFSWIAFQTSLSLIRAEQEGKKSNQHLKFITDKLPAFISYMDKNGRYLFVNETYERWFGMKREDIMGKKRAEFSSPDTAVRAQPYEDKVLRGEAVKYSNVLNGRPGQADVHLEVEYVPDIDQRTGLVRGAVIIGHDVTALHDAIQEAEAARRNLQNIFMKAKVGICILEGRDHVFSLANDVYVETLFPGRGDLIGKCVRDVLPETVGQGFVGLLDEVYDTGITYVGNETPIALQQVDGHSRMFHLNFTYQPKFDLRGAVDGIIAVVTDVTELVESRKQVESALKARDELLSICSHELRTPLSSMKLSNQMVRRQIEKETVTMDRIHKSIDSNDKQIDRLARLIEEMLDFSRISAGRLRISKDPCSFSNMVTDVTSRLIPYAESQEVVLRASVNPGIEGEFDQFRMEQVLTNLITNGIKYGEGKPVEVSLQASDGLAILCVQDQGLGISPEDSQRIFEPYERAVSVKGISGLGMGLYISKQIVEAHGGRIGLKSEVGEGSTFKIELPLKAVDSARVP